MQKVRGCAYLCIASTACRQLVSDLFHYRSLISIQSQSMVRPDSRKISRALRYLRNFYCIHSILSYGTITLFSYPFQDIHLIKYKNNNQFAANYKKLSQPLHYNTCKLSHNKGLDCSHFAHHYSGNHFRFIFLLLLRCFSSQRSPSYPIYSDKNYRMNLQGFPIRKFTDHSFFDNSP